MSVRGSAACFDAGQVHSVSMGLFRMPEGFYKNMTRLYPEEKLFASPFDRKAGMVSYRADVEKSMLQFCETELRQFIPENRYFPCY